MLERLKWWIVLSTDWKLEDVQAGLVVIISIVSFVAVFATARFFWHLSAKRISKRDDVPISALLSFTTLGEVMDVVLLLKSRMFQSKHFSLTVQCLFVIIFSVTAIFAGPISRYATRVGSIEGIKAIPGVLASRSLTCDRNPGIRLHNVTKALDLAGFPRNQLLDFMPDSTLDWVYNSNDWNSTYSAKCSITTEANITLEAYGNYTSNEFYIYDNVPGLADVYSARFLSDPNNTEWSWDLAGTRHPAKGVWDDLFFQSYAEYRPDGDGKNLWDGVPTQRMSIHLSVIGMHDVPLYRKSDYFKFDYLISKGKIPKAWYTKVECDLTRTVPVDRYNYWEAFVDNQDCPIANIMNLHFTPKSRTPYGDNSTSIKLPTGEELFRFYQAYHVSKDTHFPHPVERKITMRLPTVEISTLFIAAMSFVILLVLILLIHGAICQFTYADLYKRVPETKVDWLLQSLREAQTGTGNNANKLRAPSTNGDYEEYISSTKEKIAWEKAYYSLAHPYQTPSPSEAGFGRVSLNPSRTPSPAPPSLVPGPTPSGTFPSFVSNNNGYTALANSAQNPTPYQAPYPARSASPSFTMPPISPSINSERVVSYGMTGAKMQPIVNVAPRNERNEWEVGVVENRH